MQYTPERVKEIQTIERVTQMQYCTPEWLETGHSIFAAYDVDESKRELMFRGIYSDYEKIPKDWPGMNSWSLDEVEKFLEEERKKCINK